MESESVGTHEVGWDSAEKKDYNEVSAKTSANPMGTLWNWEHHTD